MMIKFLALKQKSQKATKLREYFMRRKVDLFVGHSDKCHCTLEYRSNTRIQSGLSYYWEHNDVAS